MSTQDKDIFAPLHRVKSQPALWGFSDLHQLFRGHKSRKLGVMLRGPGGDSTKSWPLWGLICLFCPPYPEIPPISHPPHTLHYLVPYLIVSMANNLDAVLAGQCRPSHKYCLLALWLSENSWLSENLNPSLGRRSVSLYFFLRIQGNVHKILKGAPIHALTRSRPYQIHTMPYTEVAYMKLSPLGVEIFVLKSFKNQYFPQ